jgi:hypothetical protein
MIDFGDLILDLFSFGIWSGYKNIQKLDKSNYILNVEQEHYTNRCILRHRKSSGTS